ncbi:uncharacterized protein MKK02DRAFT_37916 [Dioszegia hungarica]|uniref:Uncharacterized protein n=1 Tax=Dioszegia hungarica TaxID=4972 RepID=A0AA38H5G3_9TREE|nr:uncharacterized protein MKK02DRAFT_37916 [Dioszegia hungarica]KAI9634385.1 hypothetical protein MKK02DRAFT_37916 [Dioszegia hungarica]
MTGSDTDAIVKQLFDRPLPPLEPGTTVYDKSLVDRIAKLPEHMFVVASLHLANDDIHRAHLIAQDNEGDATGNLLHATLHRREADYWNSKYWFSRVGSHPTIPSLSDAKAFVDACEAVQKEGDGDKEKQRLREKQWEELKGLVNWTRENCK